jgi:CO/xanthine dehydrogenase Mo-binding subunit
MEAISKPVKRKDHDDKISGRALYVDDLALENVL